MTRLRSFLAGLLGRWFAPSGDEQALEPEELARVRLTAEVAADLLSYGDISLVTNPWPRGTREWVLWETSFQAQMLHNEMDRASSKPNSGLQAACERATMGRVLTPRAGPGTRREKHQAPNTFVKANGFVTSS